LRRREFLNGVTALMGTAVFNQGVQAQQTANSSRVGGMLMGSLIGDALGGPVEFLEREKSQRVLANAHDWESSKLLDQPTLDELARTLNMQSYEYLRPDTAPYGPWSARAKAGTITDDSRHKIVLMRALRTMLAEKREQLTQQDLARALIEFRPHPDREPSPELAALVEEGMREYRYAARWILGQRDREDALPVERLWAGVSNCSGQMALLPLAGLFAGDPERVYVETFRLDFLDAPIARDICSALNAGLAAALDPALDDSPVERRWDAMLAALRIDPYRFGDVPFAGRQLDKWVSLSESIVERAAGRPSTIYRLLEQEGEPVYYWDAHFTLLVPLTMLMACRFDPLAAMHLALDFGHDSDSYAQVLGAMVGAAHGMDIFPGAMTSAVADRLRVDFGESVQHWEETLSVAADQWKRDTG